MSVQPITTSTATFVPATLATGLRAGSTTDKILLNTATGRYHCASCDFTADRVGQVVPHRRKHGTKVREATTVRGSSAMDLIARATMLLVDAHGLLTAPPKGEVEATVPAEWKQRALAAEKSLKSLRRILGNDAA